MPTEPNPSGDGQRPSSDPGPTDLFARMRRWLIGPPRDLYDRSLFHRLALIPFLAWVGLGADGLSSSAYGPPEAFIALGEHHYLAPVLAAATAFTITVIALGYARIIEAFPHGGGGYVVASATLGKGAGVVSGCALLVDYVLTITVSIAAAGDALFSFLPPSWAPAKVAFEAALVLTLTVLNLRGVKESVVPMVPVFLVFLLTHAVLIVGGLLTIGQGVHASAIAATHEFRSEVSTLGLVPLALVAARAWSLGGGTYTGLEAVSNGLPILREPRVANAHKTMFYMAASLAATSAGLFLCYFMGRLHLEPGKTLNAVLGETLVRGIPMGTAFVVLMLLSEGALLVVAAQAGFLDGPRVLANMAMDGWMPRRFASLSERLTSQNGILVMGGASLIALVETRGNVGSLVLMYSINVFVTFTLSMLGMLKHTFSEWRAGRRTWSNFPIFAVGAVLCASILVVTSAEKFYEGGWITALVTSVLVAMAFVIRAHYRSVGVKVRQLDQVLAQAPLPEEPGAVVAKFDPEKPTAVLLVSGYGGLGIHLLLSVLKAFPRHFHNIVFLSVGVVDSRTMRDETQVEAVKAQADAALQKYVDLARRLGFPARSFSAVGTDPVAVLEPLCVSVGKDHPAAMFFAGQLIFAREHWYHALLHNHTAYDLQKRLQWSGLTMVILPVRMLDEAPARDSIIRVPSGV